MLSLGALNFFLGVDTTGLDRAATRVKNFGAAVEQSQRAANRGLNSNIDAYRKQENAILGGLEKLKAATNTINNLKIAPQAKLDGINQVNSAFDKLTASIAKTGATADKTTFDRSIKGYSAAVNQAIRDLQNLSAAETKAAMGAETIGKAMFAADQAARNLAASIERSSVGQADAKGLLPKTGSTPAGSTFDLSQRVNDANAAFQQKISAPNIDNAGFKKAQQEFTGTVNQIKRDFAALRADFKAPPQGFEAWQKSLHTLGSISLLTSGHLGGLSTRMFAASQLVTDFNVATAAAVGGVALFGVAVSKLNSVLVENALDMNRSQKIFQAVFQDTTLATQAFDYSAKVAQQAGLRVSDVAFNFAKFSASAKESSLTLAQTQKSFGEMAGVIGQLGLSTDSANLIFVALEQMLSKGKVASEELRKQMGNQLPGAFEIAAKAMGVTTAQLGKMMKSGDLISSQFIPKFTAMAAAVYGVDLSKPVLGLQNSLNRLDTAQTLFLKKLNDSTGYSMVYAKAVDYLAASITFLGDHINQIIAAFGAVAGAAAGFFAVLAVGAVIEAAGAVATFVAGLWTAVTALEAVTAAETVFNAVTSASVLGVIVKVIAALAGAVIGYRVFENAMSSANAAAMNTSGLETWITEQHKMRTATDETTMAMLRQAQVAFAGAKANFDNKIQEHKDARDWNNSHPWLSKIVKRHDPASRDHVDPKTGYVVPGGPSEVDTALDDLNRKGRVVIGIADIMKQPIVDPWAGNANRTDETGTGKKKKGPGINIDEVLHLSRAAQEATQMMNELFAGPDNLKLIEDAYKAKDVMQKLSGPEQVAAAKALNVPIDQLEGTIKNLITTEREAKEQTQLYIKAWEGITKTTAQVINLNDEISSLMNDTTNTSKGAFDNLFHFESIQKATEFLKDMDAQHLAGIEKRLRDLGYQGKTVHDVVTAMFDDVAQKTRVIRALQTIHDLLMDTAKAGYAATAAIAGYGRGFEVGRAVEDLVAIRQKVDEYAQSLQYLDESQKATMLTVQQFEDQLLQNRALEQAAEKAKKIATQYHDAVQTMFSDVTDNLFEVAKGAKNVGQAITDVFMNFVTTLGKNALNNLFSGVMDSLFNKDGAMSVAKTILGGGNSQKTAINANTSAIIALTLAIRADTIARGGVAGGGGGILGTLLNIGASIFGGGGGDIGSSIASFMPRAAGGPGIWGNAYQVNETGSAGDIFIPGQSGQFVPRDKLTGGNDNHIHIDASTTIDARGATEDAIAGLRNEMRQRDDFLRQRLPVIIDQRVQDSRQRYRGVG